MIPCLFSPINSSKSPSVLQRSLLLANNFDFLPFTPMESLVLLKFWKTSTAKVAGYGDPVLATDSTADADKCLVSVVEEEDSFFELELTLPDYDQQSDSKADRKIGRIRDFIFGETPDARINPKPQSPISILKQSAPKLKIFVLGKLIRKSKLEKSQNICTAGAPKPKDEVNFTVKLRIEDTAALKKKFRRRDSSGTTEGRNSKDRELDGSSRRFSKDSVHKYLSLIKTPWFVKLSSKWSTDLREPFDTTSFASPRKSEDRANGNTRFRAPCKSLGKSRSAGPLLVSTSTPPLLAVWKYDSLTQQNDGIQGAILHCKQSFSSSPRVLRVMSRCASDTSHDKAKQRTAQ